MTFLADIWAATPWWVLYFVVILVLSAICTDYRRFALWMICVGLLAVAAAVSVLASPAYWAAHALVWVAVAVVLMLRTPMVLPPALLLLAAVLVLPARFSGFPHEAGNGFLVLSDISGLAAVAGIAWPDLRETVGRAVHLAHHRRGSHLGSGFLGRSADQEKE